MFERSIEKTAADRLQQASLLVDPKLRPRGGDKKDAKDPFSDLMGCPGHDASEQDSKIVVEANEDQVKQRELQVESAQQPKSLERIP